MLEDDIYIKISFSFKFKILDLRIFIRRRVVNLYFILMFIE